MALAWFSLGGPACNSLHVVLPALTSELLQGTWGAPPPKPAPPAPYGACHGFGLLFSLTREKVREAYRSCSRSGSSDTVWSKGSRFGSVSGFGICRLGINCWFYHASTGASVSRDEVDSQRVVAPSMAESSPKSVQPRLSAPGEHRLQPPSSLKHLHHGGLALQQWQPLCRLGLPLQLHCPFPSRPLFSPRLRP